MDDNKKFWQRFAWLYVKFTRGSKSADRAYTQMEELICRQLNDSMKVLELAAGPGIMSAKLAAACGTLEATDFSQNMLLQAQKRRRPDNVNFAVADATNLVYENQSFDAVVIANALHIMPEPVKALKEIKRVLKGNGILIAPTFIRENVKSRAVEGIMELFGFKTYSRWTYEEYKNFLMQQELEIYCEKIIIGHNFPIAFMACNKKRIE